MQVRFFKKLSFFIFLNCFFSCLFPVENILKKNPFFEKVDYLILQVSDTNISNNLNDDAKKQLQRKRSLIKQLISFSRKIVSYKFSCRKMGISELSKHLTKISNFEDKLLNTEKKLFNDKELEGIKKIFESLKKGICFSLSKDHLMILRIKTFDFLEHLFFLIAAWKNQFAISSIERKLEDIFSKETWHDHIKNKIRGLLYLKTRLSSYLGKIDDLFEKFIELECEKDDSERLNGFDNFIYGGTYCINSFLLKDFDPDSVIYNEDFENFRKYNIREIISVASNNHSNILLSENDFQFQIKGFKLPGFFNRNWFKLSILSFLGTAGGVYIYNNWNKLTSDHPESVKMRSKKFYGDGKKIIKNSYSNATTFIKDKFWPDRIDSKKSESKLKEVRKIISNDIRSDFDSLRKYSQINEEEFETLTKEEKKIQKKLKNIFSSLPEDFQDPNVLFDAINRIQKEIMSSEIEKMLKTCGQFNTVSFKEALNNLMAEFDAEHEVDERTNRVVGWFVDQFGLSTETVKKLNNEVDIAITKYKAARENGSLTEARDSLLNIISGILDIIKVPVSQMPTAGILVKLYKIIAYKIVADVLEVAEESVTTLDVTLNWIRALTTIIVPSVIVVFVVKRKIKNNRIQKDKEINSMIFNIWEVFNRYNLLEADYYHHDLQYKDRGESNFWLDRLEKKVNIVSLKDRRQFLDLILELKRPDISIRQKIEIIKIKWGSNLVNNPLVI